ncbi:hypothetical protein [uncultured Spirosoma sp.]|uniref:hypothetical protein n=1 Tax=uncultured Spirosoma sp. TaxID=278208 RepID=UPI00258EB7A9|nr:hypothetical protein [uncultured Spirosoma sp.]
MRKVVSIGLFILLLCHVLGCGIAAVSSWWQEETTLMERLAVYHTTDSLIEFQIPLADSTQAEPAITRTTAGGFTYHNHYYDIVSLNIQNDTLYIAGIELDRHAFWEADLLSFLKNHLADAGGTQKRVNQVLKLLLQEYDPPVRTAFQFLVSLRAQAAPPVSDVISPLFRSLPVGSPPPEISRSFSLLK